MYWKRFVLAVVFLFFASPIFEGFMMATTGHHAVSMWYNVGQQLIGGIYFWILGAFAYERIA